jgi:hypothetical protein
MCEVTVQIIRRRDCTGLTGQITTGLGRDARTNNSDCTVSQPEDHHLPSELLTQSATLLLNTTLAVFSATSILPFLKI